MSNIGKSFNRNHVYEYHAPSLLGLAKAALEYVFSGGNLHQLQESREYQNLSSLAPAIRVNVTLRCDGRVRGSRSAPGRNLAEQVHFASIKAAGDGRFNGSLTRIELERTSIELWIQTGSTDISIEDRLRVDALDLGVDGLEIEGHGKHAFHKPSFAITKGLSTPENFFSALCLKAGLNKLDWKSQEIRLAKTDWSCWLINPQGEKLKLSALRRQPEEAVKAKDIPRWLLESCVYFVRNQQATGMIAYVYDPIKNRISDRSLNRVRACGCLYALALALQHSEVREVKQALEQASRCLAEGLLRQTTLWKDGCRVVSEKKMDHPPKLGATALLLAALSFDPLKASHESQVKELYRSVLLAQKSDGRFITHFGLSEENLGLANYYSGEALLALVLQAEHGDDVAAETCRRSFRPYRDHFRAAPTTAFIGWHAGVWSRLAIAEANEEYADFVFEQIDWLLRWQICKSKTSEWIGGFSEAARVPQSASVVYTEAILHALRLAHLTGNRERSERFAEAARRALMFCARLRLENVPTTFFPDPLRCRGGVAMGLAKKTVRSDVVQHFITMCLAAIANPVEIL